MYYYTIPRKIRVKKNYYFLQTQIFNMFPQKISEKYYKIHCFYFNFLFSKAFRKIFLIINLNLHLFILLDWDICGALDLISTNKNLYFIINHEKKVSNDYILNDLIKKRKVFSIFLQQKN